MTTSGDEYDRRDGHDTDAKKPHEAPAPAIDAAPRADVRMDADGDHLPDAAWVSDQRKSVNAAGVGVQFGMTIVVFALLGLWADRKLDTSPWLLLAGVTVGFGGGTVSLLKKFK